MAARTPKRLAPTTPVVVGALGVIALLWIILPVLALGVRVPWDRIGEILTMDETADLLKITLVSAIFASIITLLLGIPLAMWLQHLRRGAGIARLLVLLPLAMPPVVSGLALTAFIGRRGLTAPILDALGLQFAFAFPGVVASHVFVALPFVVVTLDAALRQIDPEIPASAAGIGMSPNRIAWRITLPAIAPSVATAAGLAFARSLGEFGTTLTFAGSMPGKTRTMSLGIYLLRETDQAAAYALSAVLIALAIVSLLLASIPSLFAKKYSPSARSLGTIDTQRLRELTRPKTTGVDIIYNDTHIPADRITAIIGQNGSGKTTMAGLIAGRLTGSDVTVGGRVVDKQGQRPVPAFRRGVVLLTQRPGLPRTETVTSALTMVTRDANRTRELLEASGLTDLADVPVPALSGGQAAQVALVRALAARPCVLLLDEPLAAVDVASGRAWRQVLRAIAQDRTTLMITHNPLDIAGLSEFMVVLDHGKVLSAGPTADELALPANNFVAGISGLNRLTGIISAINNGMVTVNAKETTILGTLVENDVPSKEVNTGRPVVVTVPPEATTLRLPEKDRLSDAPRESARNLWRGTVVSIDAPPTNVPVSVHVDLGGTTITVPVTRESALELGLEPGINVECVTKALNVSVHPHRQEG